MFCLLCNELQIDTITLTSQEAKQQRISSLLFKHFRFCFDDEPANGDLCRYCWQKLVSFHEFYIRIESVREQINRIPSCTLTIKEENIEEDDEQITQLYGSESSFKYEPMLFEDSTSETATTGDNIKEGDDNNEDETNDDFECNTPIEVINAAKYAANEVLPSSSKHKYEEVYRVFKKWQTFNEAPSISGTVLVAFFHELAQKNKPSTLCSYYSMLKATIKLNDNIDIGAYHEITAFIKSKSSGYIPVKASVFTGRQIQKFIHEAPDDDWLDVKVVAIFAASGPCRAAELSQIKLKDIENHGEMLLVRIMNTKRKDARSFRITGEFYSIVQKYAALRPAHTIDNRFFVNYQRGKCTMQVIGRNKLNRMSRRIATYLLLPKPECYSGSSFRRTSAAKLSKTSANMETTKALGSLRSSVVAEEYIEESFTIKIEQ